MSIPEIENQLAEEFGAYDDWLDKYNVIVEMGKSLPMIDPQYKTDPYLITGCQSKVWLHAVLVDGKILFTADSDAIITKGIVNLLIQVLSNQTPDEILGAKLEFIDRIGLKEHLSPTRSNGLANMVKQMKLYALAFKTRMAGTK
ncbi:MAG: SufE family protein [Bacteroidota bacterium]